MSGSWERAEPGAVDGAQDEPERHQVGEVRERVRPGECRRRRVFALR